MIKSLERLILVPLYYNVFCSLSDRLKYILSLEIVVISQSETNNKKLISKLMVKGFIQEFTHRIVKN